MFAEDELLPLSALQHLVFCERQAALIHLEQAWMESAATIEGHHLHETVDSGTRETRGPLVIARHLAVRSLRLGVTGVADVVEFRRDDSGVALEGRDELYRPFPVEYKRGRPKRNRADEVQVCAQALCLEEMLGTTVPSGALFYGKTRRRSPVEFDHGLRLFTEEAAARLHQLWAARRTPPAEYGPKCEECSLLDVCRPRAGERSALKYVEDLFA